MTDALEPQAVNPARSMVYEVKDFIDAAQLKRDLEFSPNDLTGAMMAQASLFAHYGVLAANASRQVDVVEMLLENTEAAVYKKVRDEFNLRAEKFTEALLEKTVMRDQRVRSMKSALNEAKRVEALGKTAVEAFRHRRDMLIQHGLISREEMKGELYIRGRSAASEVEDAKKESFLNRKRES